jgi:hypothetical protein
MYEPGGLPLFNFPYKRFGAAISLIVFTEEILVFAAAPLQKYYSCGLLKDATLSPFQVTSLAEAELLMPTAGADRRCYF